MAKLSTGLLLHSDRGSQYTSKACQALLAEKDIICSMSAPPRKIKCIPAKTQQIIKEENQLLEIRELNKQRYEKLKKEERLQKVKNFLNKVQTFDRELELFKENFYDFFSNGFVEQIETLLKTLQELYEKAKTLAKEGLIDEAVFQDVFEKCQVILQSLLDKHSFLSKYCYENFVIPLIDHFWNFKFKLENLYNQIKFDKFPKKQSSVEDIEIETIENQDSNITIKFDKNRNRMLQVSLLQKFKDEKEMYAPSLSQAFVKAAASGTPEDLDDLLFYGAHLDGSASDKKLTALNNAVFHQKLDNVHYLLSKHANIKLYDHQGFTPASYANNSKNKKLIAMLGSGGHQAIQMHDILLYILSFVPVEKLYLNKQVSSFWKDQIEKLLEINLNKIGLQSHVKRFKNLPNYLQYIISKWLVEKKEVKKIKELFNALMLSYEERVDNIFPNDKNLKIYKDSNRSHIVSDTGLTLYLLGILTSNEAINRAHDLCTPYGSLLMTESLLTEKQVNLFKHSGSSLGSHDNLRELVNKNGFIALRNKLLTADQAPFISDLKALLSDFGLQALREKLITVEQVKGIYHSGSANGPHSNLLALMSKNGLIALRKKFITPEQAAYISSIQILLKDEILALFDKGLISFNHERYAASKIKTGKNLLQNLSAINNHGIAALEEKLITQEQLEKITSAAPLFTKNGLEALRIGIITSEQAAQVKDLESLLSDSGIQALSEGIITIEQAQKYKNLKILKMPFGRQALKEGLITHEQIALLPDYNGGIGPRSLNALFSELGLQALRDKLITPEQAAKFYHSGSPTGPFDNLSDLLTPIGLASIRKKLISPEQANQINCLQLLFKDNDKNIIVALEYNLINLNDFKHGGKYYNNGASFKKDLQKSISNLNDEQKNNNELTNSCVIVQKYWRGYMARKKLGLFKELQGCMKSGNLHCLAELYNTKLLIDQNKLQDASTQIVEVKTKLAL